MSEKEKVNEMTKEEKIKMLRAEIKEIKTQGSFKGAYNKLRKGSVLIFKNDNDNNQKKQSLRELCQEVIEYLEEQ